MQIHADPDPNHCIHLRHTWDASRVAEPELGFLVWSLLTHEANEETISSQGLGIGIGIGIYLFLFGYIHVR